MSWTRLHLSMTVHLDLKGQTPGVETLDYLELQQVSRVLEIEECSVAEVCQYLIQKCR